MSKDQYNQKKISHKDSKGRNTPERVKDFGYKFALLVENVGENHKSSKAMVQAWIKSDDHRNNILCKECTEIGVKQYGGYWTMLAAKPLNSQQEAATPTTSQVVTNTPTATDVPKDTGKEITPTRTRSKRNNNADIPTAVTTLPPGTTGILLQIRLSGVTDPSHSSRPVTVSLFDDGNKELAKIDSSMSYDSQKKSFIGAVALPESIETGSYIIKVKTDRSLTRTISSGFTSLKAKEVTKLPDITLATVDLDENNVISLADVLYYRSCSSSGECADEETDINDDGENNILDYNVFLEVFGSNEGK
jgi:hypothetical protein